MSKAKPFQFISLALLTQGVLLLNQIALLPIQIRVWGTETAAYWYSTVAFAALMTAADFGLRTAGHAEFIRYALNPDDHEARTEFQHLWDWMRILLLVSTTVLVGFDYAFHLFQGASYPLWRPALVIGISLETLLIVRMMYLDSLGRYTESEGGYLLLAAGRFVVAIIALLVFHAPPSAIAWIWLILGILSIFQQGWLCRRVPVLRIFAPFAPGLSFKTLAIARHTMADPCSNWMRFNAPVLVLSVIAQPAAITTYVALRALFGAARATISQLSRYASVDYILRKQVGDTARAEFRLTLCMLATAFFASVLGCIVITDNFRIASIWLFHANAQLYQAIALMFAVGSAFSSYQIMVALMLRSGEVDRIARRQYLYILYAAIFAVVALISRSTLLWLVMILLAEITISLFFMLKTSRGGVQSQTSAGQYGCAAATASALLSLVLWVVVRVGHFNFLTVMTPCAFAATALFAFVWILLTAAVYLYIMRGLFVRTKPLPFATLDPLPAMNPVPLRK
jgi:hypothetical protein